MGIKEQSEQRYNAKGRDHLFGSLHILEEKIKKSNNGNIKEVKPELEKYISKALSWESASLE